MCSSFVFVSEFILGIGGQTGELCDLYLRLFILVVDMKFFIVFCFFFGNGTGGNCICVSEISAE